MSRNTKWLVFAVLAALTLAAQNARRSAMARAVLNVVD
jgi:hypothetical protein